MCIIPSIAIGSNFQAIQNNNFMKLEQHWSCPRQWFFHSACCIHQSAELSLELWNFLSFEHNTLCVCVCVWNRRSQFSYYRCTQDISKHMMPTSKNQLPRLQWQFTFALDNGMNLLSLALDKREREIVTRFRVQTYFCVGYQISINFKMAKYISIRAFRRQSTYTFVLSECRESVCISCFQFWDRPSNYNETVTWPSSMQVWFVTCGISECN
jgi:hypothetical protein